MEKEKRLEEDISNQYKTYLDLEKYLMEFTNMYKKNPSEEIYYIIGKIYTNCINQVDNLFAIVSDCFKKELQEYWRNQLKDKYTNLEEIGDVLRNLHKSTKEEQEVMKKFS